MRSVEFMPLPLSLLTGLNTLVWSAYSFYVGDPFLGAPNYMGVALSAAQLALFAAYRPGGPMGGASPGPAALPAKYGALEVDL